MAMPERVAAWSYLWLDLAAQRVIGYLRYRRAATRCFFSGPRLGHLWEGNALVRSCSRCPKRWVGNL